MMRAIFVFTQDCEHCIERLQEGLSAHQRQADTNIQEERVQLANESDTHQQHVDTSVQEDPDPPSYSTAKGQTPQIQIESYPRAMTIANRRILGPRFEAAMLSYAEEAVIIQGIIEGFISHKQLDIQYITPLWVSHDSFFLRLNSRQHNVSQNTSRMTLSHLCLTPSTATLIACYRSLLTLTIRTQ